MEILYSCVVQYSSTIILLLLETWNIGSATEKPKLYFQVILINFNVMATGAWWHHVGQCVNPPLKQMFTKAI